MVKMTVKAPDLRTGDVVFEPDNPEKRMYKVVDVLGVRSNHTIIHILDRSGSFSRELPNHVDYPIEREEPEE